MLGTFTWSVIVLLLQSVQLVLRTGVRLTSGNAHLATVSVRQLAGLGSSC